MLFVRSFVVMVIAVTSLDVRNRCYAVTEFEPVQFYKTVPAPTVLHTQEAISLLHCAVLCLSTSGCTSFDFHCQSLLEKTPGLCNALSNTVSSTAQLSASGQCFVQTKIGPATVLPLVPPSATPPTATPSTTTAMPSTTTLASSPAATTTASPLVTLSSSTSVLASSTSAPGATIKGFFQNGVAWETDSYVMVTSAGAVVYRNYDALTFGDTLGPYELSVILPGYSDLPNIADVECVMHLYNTGGIELYSGGKVYVWDGNLTNLHSTGQLYSAYLGSNVNAILASETIKMCAYRHVTSDGERHFLMTSGNVLIVSPSSIDSEGKVVYSASQLDATDTHIWNGLPVDIVAVTNKFTDFNDTYVIVKQNLSLYQYLIIMGTDGVPIYFGKLQGITSGAR